MEVPEYLDYHVDQSAQECSCTSEDIPRNLRCRRPYGLRLGAWIKQTWKHVQGDAEVVGHGFLDRRHEGDRIWVFREGFRAVHFIG